MLFSFSKNWLLFMFLGIYVEYLLLNSLFSSGSCGAKMQTLQSQDTTDVLMYLLRLKQIKQQGSMIMPPSITKLNFIRVRV